MSIPYLDAGFANMLVKEGITCQNVYKTKRRQPNRRWYAANSRM